MPIMSTEYESSVLCLVLLLCTGINAIEYSKKNAGLREVPGNIPLTVTYIDLSRNELTEIYDHEFSRFKLLLFLRLSYNKIRNLSAFAFDNTRIDELYLYDNELVAVPNVCVLSETLEILSLAHNKIQTVDSNLINCLTNIKKLLLSNNPFTRLSDNTFTGLELLDTLELFSTGISSSPVLTNQHLTILDISNTTITTLVDPALSNCQIDKIWITDINLVCNCSVAWMLMSNIRGWPSTITKDYHPCKNPSAFREVTWTELTTSDLCTGDIRLWEITYKEGPSVTIRFNPNDSTVTSPVNHYILQYSNVNETDWKNGTTVPSTGNVGEFVAVTQDGLKPGVWYMLRVVPVVEDADTFVKLWDIFNGTGPFVTIRVQIWDSKIRETLPVDHYVVQYHTHGNKYWRNGSTVTPMGEKVTPFNQPEGQSSSGGSNTARIGGAIGGVLFLLVVLLLIGSVIYMRRKKDRHVHDNTEPQVFPGQTERSDERTHVSGPEVTHFGNVVYENQETIDSAGYEPIRAVAVPVREQQEHVYQELQE